MKIIRLLVLAFALISAGHEALADGTSTLDKGALTELMSGSTVEVMLGNGDTARWTNAADGTLSAHEKNGPGSARHYSLAGDGTWKIADDGQYCGHIQWAQSATDWCGVVTQIDDGGYALHSSEGSLNWKMRITK
jgi:Protein of unknown function (DUF995)